MAYLRARLAEARLLGWGNLLFGPVACLPLILSVPLIVRGVELVRADVAGSVVITSCEPAKGGFDCDGAFTSVDGSVHIDRVRLYPYFAQDDPPTGTVDGWISGHGATQAARSRERFPVPLWGGIAMGLIGLYWVYALYLTPDDDGPAATRRRNRRRSDSAR